jgi:hypothetical protein
MAVQIAVIRKGRYEDRQLEEAEGGGEAEGLGPETEARE